MDSALQNRMAYTGSDLLLLTAASHRKAYQLMHESSKWSQPPVERSDTDRNREPTDHNRIVSAGVRKTETEPYTTRPIVEPRLPKKVAPRKLPYDGEYGPQSYEAWQMDDYFMIRPLLNEFVDGVLSLLNTSTVTYKPKSPDLSAATPSRVAPLIAELMFEVTDKISEAVMQPVANVSHEVNEHFAQLVQKAADKADEKARGGHDRSDGVAFADSAIAQHQKERTQLGDDVWAHSSNFPTNFEPRSNAVGGSEDQSNVLDFNQVTATGLQPVNGSNQQQQEAQYRQLEAEYWSHMSPGMALLGGTNGCTGISRAKVSFNQRYVAYGTFSGELLVADFRWVPPRPVRLGLNDEEAAVIEISWSLDSYRLATLDSSGSLSVWSMMSSEAGTKPVSSSRSFNMQPDSYGILPIHLSMVSRLNLSNFSGLAFPSARGSNSAGKHAGRRPVCAAFDRSLTILGSQPIVAVGFQDGSIISCNIETRLKPDPDYVTDEPASEMAVDIAGNEVRGLSAIAERNESVGSETRPLSTTTFINRQQVFPEAGAQYYSDNRLVSAELYRGHTQRIISMGFVDNFSNMVTVDSSGVVAFWTYESKTLNADSSFRPQRKYRLKASKSTYIAMNTPPKVLYSEEDAALNSDQHRIAAENIVSRLHPRNLWHRYYDENSLETTLIYEPVDDVSPDGGDFHVVTRSGILDRLLSYAVQLYRPTSVNWTKLVCAQFTTSGREIVFLLLFPSSPPKDALLMLLILDLHTATLRNFRKDMAITDNELYSRCLQNDVISCQVSQPFGATGSSYVFLNLDGQISGYSLSTGQKVFRIGSNSDLTYDGFLGCHIPGGVLTLTAETKIAVIGSTNKLAFSFHSTDKQSARPVQLLQLVDKNSHESRTGMWTAFRRQNANREENNILPAECRIDGKRWLANLNPESIHILDHPVAFVRGLLSEVIDRVLAEADEEFETDEQLRSTWAQADRVDNYICAMLTLQ